MKIFPAIDILDNKAVRLLYGRRENVTVYGDPREIAERWIAGGAEILHIVDLNGAFDSSDVNRSVIGEIVKNIKVPVQLGGGIKSFDRAKYAIEELGCSRIVMGTAAVLNPEIFEDACAKYGAKIVCGIDVLDGKVAVKGWVEKGEMSANELATKVKKMGVKDVVFTDISRDGALSGVNFKQTAKLQLETGINVIASGGVCSVEDIVSLKNEGVYGVILGRALYTGDLSIGEATAFAK